MTMNQLREHLRPFLGHRKFSTENTTTNYDGYFDRWTGYMEHGMTLDTDLDPNEILELTDTLIDSIYPI